MKPPPFDYLCPTSLDEALSLRTTTAGSGVVLAGGQSLVPILNLRLASPALLIDVGRVSELATISVADGRLRIGSCVRQRVAERSAEVASGCPLLSEALPWIGHPSTRNRGTVGGSLAHADPAAELPTVALALEAGLVVRSERGQRTVAASEFFRGFMSTALEPDELLIEIVVDSLPPRTGTAFAEVARRHGDFALVAVAVVLRLSAKGEVDEARVVLAGVGGVPIRAGAVEALLVGAEPGAAVFGEAARVATDDLEPHGDLHASAAYRRHVAGVLISRALETAARRAQERM